VSVFIASVILLILGTAYAVLLRRKLAETVFLAVFTVTGVLYCFGFINRQGCLLYGIYSIIIISFVCVLFLLYVYIKHRQNFRDVEPLKGCVIYASFLAFSLFFNYGVRFTGWDEFANWGIRLKHLYFINAFATVESPKFDLLFKAYLPGTSIFQYFFLKFSNKFTEYYSYIGMNIMYLSLVMPFIKNIFSKKQCIKVFVLTAVFIMIPLTVSRIFYSDLYVDTILGAFFGFSLLYYFAYEYEKSLYGIMMVSAAVFMLTITKDMGFLFSLIVIAVMAVDIIFYKRTWIKKILYKEAGAVHKLKNILLLIFPLFSSLFAKIAWSNLLNRSNIQTLWNVPTGNELYKFFFGPLEQYQEETRYKFFLAMFRLKIPYINVSIVSFSIIITIVILFLSLISDRKIRVRRIITSAVLLVMGLFAYLFVLILLYMFSFDPYEAVNLASYDRYIHQYIIAMMLFVIIFYIIEQSEQKINFSELKAMFATKEFTRRKAIFTAGKYFLYILISVVLFIALINTTSGKLISIDAFVYRITHFGYSDPRPTAVFVEKWKPYFEKDDPLIIIQGDQGYWYYVMQYDLVPYSKVANGHDRRDYSISTIPYYQNDQWTLIITPEEWENSVLTSNVKLLYTLIIDQNFVNSYGHFFQNGVQQDMCYYVQNERGHLILVPVIQ